MVDVIGGNQATGTATDTAVVSIPKGICNHTYSVWYKMQPLLPMMVVCDCRVDLNGNGEATGTATDTAVVSTPRPSCNHTHPIYLHAQVCHCRVNLIGGGEAIGTATDTAVVFTPGEAAHNQMYLYNMTLPHGFFSQAPPGTSTHLGSVESESHVA